MIRPLLLAAALFGCTAAAPAPTFDPLAFFTGPSRGEGTLKILFKSSIPIRVESHGRPDGKGGIVLDQTIREGAKPLRTHRWSLSPTSATTLVGTGSDNPGLIKGWMNGNKLLINYTMKNGMQAEQILTLQPGGRSVLNRMTIKRLGIAVAHIKEVITKVD